MNEYDMRSRREAAARLIEADRQPLKVRKEAQMEFHSAMRDPALVGERIGWLIDGNYGYGEMLKAKDIVANKRMNRNAALTHLVAVFEWSCPQDMAIGAWKKLTKKEQADLDAVVSIVVKEAEKEES